MPEAPGHLDRDVGLGSHDLRRVRTGLDLCQSLNGVKQRKAFPVAAPSGRTKCSAGILVVSYAVITILPLLSIIVTGFKWPPDAIACPPKIVFGPAMEDYADLFTMRSRATVETLQALWPPASWCDRIVRDQSVIISGPSRYGERFVNSVIIGFGQRFLCMMPGTAAAYARARFKVPLNDDLLFLILSTRMTPPIAEATPGFLPLCNLGLNDTHLSMILLNTAVNLSLAVWRLKGFNDRFPVQWR